MDFEDRTQSIQRAVSKGEHQLFRNGESAKTTVNVTAHSTKIYDTMFSFSN